MRTAPDSFSMLKAKPRYFTSWLLNSFTAEMSKHIQVGGPATETREYREVFPDFIFAVRSVGKRPKASDA